ncbi:hypothetical protein HK100_005042 [Physocladia obscura]|uniref:Calponin-homology (CH) domain-containing protein n=1 Tax=Physocladia obscura TaxID=109957 RepID=A0AAD5TB91_9FUNG|nr:hypothetical protein HK100_005042 [Physocladia obscura]
MTEINNIVVNSAKAIGCSVVNIGAQDFIEGREHLALGLIWQIIKIGLQARVDIKYHPELFRHLEDGESLEQFLKLPVEQILLSGDVKDGENYTVLLAQLAPHLCDRSPLQTRDLLHRAELVLSNSVRMNLNPKTLVEGNTQLNFVFVANLFNNWPGLEKLSDAEKAELDDSLLILKELVKLEVIDKVRPGFIDWRKVNKPGPITSRFKQVENTNYVLALGKDLKFSLGVQGSDITDGVKNLTLDSFFTLAMTTITKKRFCLELMREHIIQTLKSLSGRGNEISESDIIAWANNTVKLRAGKSTTISLFKDPGLANGVFLLDLLNGIQKGVVDYSMVGPGRTEKDALLNAKYAISIARKLGATIFVLPEDIVEVKPKMILAFVGTLMALDKSGVLNH